MSKVNSFKYPQTLITIVSGKETTQINWILKALWSEDIRGINVRTSKHLLTESIIGFAKQLEKEDFSE